VPLLLQLFFWYFSVLRALPLPQESYSLLQLAFLNNRGVFLPSIHLEGSVLALLVAALAGAAISYGLRFVSVPGQVDQVRWRSFLRFAPLLILVLPCLVFFATGMSVQTEVPDLKGFGFKGGWSLIPEFVALVLALSIYTAAFIAENVRSGILSVSKGQTEAARALGLKPGRVLRLVIVPQALRVVIPPLTSQYLNLTKNSSLAVAIAYPDLVSVFSGTVLNQTGQAVEVIAITMTIYLGLSLFTSLFMNWYNRHMALVER